MKRLRLLLLLAGAGLLLCLALAAVALTPSFQTWALRRAIASRVDLKASLGELSAGMNRAEITDLRAEFRGAAVTIPRVEIDVPVLSAGWQRKVIVTRLVAHGWTMTFPTSAGVAPAAGDVRRVSAEAAVQAFVGVFAQLQLPVDVALDGVDLQGEVVLPESRGRVRVGITGGGLNAGRDAKFALTATAALTGGDVQSVEMKGELGGRMGSPRSFDTLAVTLDATAVGPDFPGGAKLRADARATRGGSGETYAATIVADGREVLSIAADFPTGASRIDGRWSIKARDADLAPFSLGKALPAFSLAGEGSIDADSGFRAVHLAGRLEAKLDRLGVLGRELDVLGPLTLDATFDLAQRGGAVAVRKIEASLGAGAPVATVRLAQEFEINPGTRELRTAEVARELLAITLHGAPLAWARPWLDGADPGAAVVRGELFATPRDGGVALRSRAPLAVEALSVSRAGRKLIERVDVLASLSADYTPQGWQVEVPGLTAKAGGVTLLTAEARAGRLVGASEPVKATGRVIASVPPVLAQPFAGGPAALATGEIDVSFVASLAGRREVQAGIVTRDFSLAAGEQPRPLPALSVDLRIDAAPGGIVTFGAPVVIERDGRRSDLNITGTLAPAPNLPPVVEALVTGTRLFVEDAQVLALAFARPPGAVPVPTIAPGPPWAGWNGAINLRLKELVYSDTLRASNVTGRVRLDAGMVKLEGLQAGLGGPARAEADGRLSFDVSAPQPYVLAAAVRLRDIDPVPWWRALGGGETGPVEGRFDFAGSLAGEARNPGGLAGALTAEVDVTSKGGLFRVLPVNVAQAAEASGLLAGIISSIGNLTGRKAGADIAGRAEAVAEFVRALNPLAYDQLSVQLARDASRNTTLKNFALIAPELRLTGAGAAIHEPGAGPFDDALTLEFRLRARGRQAEVLKYLGLLDAKPDHLGYAACSLPIRVGGTVGNPDTSELNRRLAELALEKGLLDRLIGGGK